MVPAVKVAHDASGNHMALTVHKEKAGKAQTGLRRTLAAYHRNRTPQRGRSSSQWFVLTAVYTSPSVAWRKFLWPYLQSLDLRSDFPWLLGGDFNAILRPEEKLGDSSLGPGYIKSFYDFVHDLELFEVAHKGSDFTWKRGLLYKRLDRCFLNEKWIS
ncbi:hypothetical protein V6N13_004631 [Hibiscus sabdariffa]